VPSSVPPETLSSSISTPELWLAIHLPQFMLDALRGSVTTASAKSPVAEPIAVVDIDRDGKVVRACNVLAVNMGVTPGMAINSALALAPALQTFARDTHREQLLLESVATLGLELFTPRISLEPPDGLLLEVRGSLRLMGGARRLFERLREELQKAGVSGQLALTPTPLASLWFARVGQEVMLRRRESLPGRLAPLPLAQTTRWPERNVAALATMGVRTIGDCLRLPRDGFARRFEPQMLTMLDRASGRLPDPRPAYHAPGKFSTHRELEPETADLGRLGLAIAPLIDELCAFLRKRGRGVQSIELRLVHRVATATRLRMRFVQPTDQAQRIAELLQERLARLQLPEPVRRVRLRSGPLRELPVETTTLFAHERRESSTAVPQLIERLRARLGDEAVHGVCLMPEHRPESAWRRCGWPDAAAMKQGAQDPGADTFRPLWLLAEPQALETDEDGRFPRYEGALAIEEGPERIESGWWDGKDVARDYYVARDPVGVRLWIYRERGRSSRSSRSGHGWFLHGVFG
jgi:protein ImuB